MLLPVPKPCGPIHDPDRAPIVRRLTCVNYGHCLGLAHRAGFRGFMCPRGCEWHVERSRDSLRADLDGLALFLAALSLPDYPFGDGPLTEDERTTIRRRRLRVVK